MSAPFKIAYFGLPLGALLLLRDGCSLEPCVLSPVPAAGRRRLARALAGETLIDALDADPFRFRQQVDGALARSPPDLLVSWFWTRLIPLDWLAAARLGGIGVHPSLLPRHRGPNPYFWSIDSGDRLAGVTLHRLSEAYDTGDILESEALEIGERNAWQLARALDRPSLRLLRRGVAGFRAGRPPPAQPQSEELASYAPEPSGDELRADRYWSSERVLRRIRALSPVPGLALSIRGLNFFATRAEPTRAPDPLEIGEAGVFGDPPALVLRVADGGVAISRAVLGVNDGLVEGRELDRTALAELIAARG